IDRRVQPFVRVERDRISQIEPGKHRPEVFDHRSRRAIRAVDVKPEIVFAGNAGDLSKRIDGARGCGSRATDNAKRFESFTSILIDRGTQGRGVEAKALVAGQQTYAVLPQAENVRRFGDGKMDLIRSIDSHWCGRAANSNLRDRNIS